MATANTSRGDHVSPEFPITNFAARLIRRKSRELTSRADFSTSDRDDIEQELSLVLLRRLDEIRSDDRALQRLRDNGHRALFRDDHRASNG